MLERRHALAVGQARVGAGLDEQADDLLVRRTAVAEDDGLQQRRPAEIVDVIDVHVGLQQRAYDVHVTTVGGGDQRCSAETVRPAQVRTCAQHLSQHVDVAGLAGREQRVRARVVLEIDVGARGHEHAHRLRRAGVRGRGDRGAAGLVAAVDVGPCLQEPRDLRGVAALGRPNELHVRHVAIRAVARSEQSDAGEAREPGYSTVTVLARLRGWSTLRPRRRAIR